MELYLVQTCSLAPSLHSPADLSGKQFYEPVISVRHLHVQTDVLPRHTDVTLLEVIIHLCMHVNH